MDKLVRHVGAALLLATIATTGCRSTQKAPPRQATPVAMPSSYSSHTDGVNGTATPDFSFEDPELACLIGEALVNNRDLRAASARVLIAIARARTAGADQLPGVNFGANGSRTRQNFGLGLPGTLGGGSVLSDTSSRYNLSLDATWELDLWGRLSARTRSAIAEYQATCADVQAARLSIAAQVAKGWLALTETRLQVDLAQQTVASFQQTLNVASARTQEGVSTPVDEHLTDANLAAAEALLARRQAESETASRTLETLVGRVPRGQLRGASDLPPQPAPLGPGVPAHLIRRRPDLVASERRLASAVADLRAARADLYPRISLTGSTGTASDSLSNLLSGDFLIWSLAAGLLQPVFDGGRLRAAVSSASGVRKEALELFAARVLDALREVEVALAVEDSLRRRIVFLDRASRSSDSAATIATTRYEGGIEPLLTVLESQRRLLDAKSTLISARREVVDTRIDLILALGGRVDAPPCPPQSTTVATGEQP